MFVIPYIMGPPGSPLTKIGFEITDSIYVVLSMRIMTRMGEIAVKRLGNDPKAEFNRGVHSLLDVNPERRFICHFPQDNAIISVGSGYGGNVLLGKNAWRCASAPISGKSKAGSPSTCSSSAWNRRKGENTMSRRLSPAPAARPTSP